MFIRSVVVFYIFISSSKAEDMYVVSKSHSGYLDVYKSYSDVTLLHFNVPRDTSFVSFKFEADEMDFSIFGKNFLNSVKLFRDICNCYQVVSPKMSKCI